MNLCINCLSDGAKGFPVGPERGTQRDPYFDTVKLCGECASALTNGRFDVLHERYNAERTVRREH